MKKPSKRIALRTYSPLPLQITLIYLGQNSAGRGIVQELSRAGCRILGNEPVIAGETLGVHLLLPITQKPLLIEQATVKWVKGWEFGLAFKRLHPQEADELQRLLDELLGNGASPTAACLHGSMPCAHRLRRYSGQFLRPIIHNTIHTPHYACPSNSVSISQCTSRSA